jgi:hypothetical protein
MTMRNFIKENRGELDAYIKLECPNCRKNDDEREMWIRNDEYLYNWARSRGVRV